ncbi:MAG: response regulator transcription factor [Puniceicoccales bacterium]|jgi:DNA-binding response OmpR family regulator|nr:response regulator transcription factor [Puniceicoccales bacterium]
MGNESKKPLVVVADGDRALTGVLVSQMASWSMRAVAADSLRNVEKILEEQSGALLILNVALPDGCGLNFIKTRRQSGENIPAIFLVNRGQLQDKIRALTIGDDVLEKPLSCAELHIRIRSVLRRSVPQPLFLQKLQLENFTIGRGQVLAQRQEIVLPDGTVFPIGHKELGLLAMLAMRRHQIVPRRDLILGVWGFLTNPYGRSLDQYIVRIRKLLHRCGCGNCLQTVHGVGYLLADG